MTYDSIEDFKAFVRSKGMHVMEKGDVERFGKIAGDAYPLDYPIFPYYFGEKNSREKINLTLVVNYNAVFRYGFGFSPADTSLGSALFVPPEHKGFGTWDFMKSGGIKLFLKCGMKACDKMSVYEKYCANLLYKYRDDRTWYFQNLTVAKDHQGEGVGSGMLKVIWDYLDSTDMSCYLETHNLPNARLYERFGFKIMEVGKLPGTDIEHYAMFRKHKSERDKN